MMNNRAKTISDVIGNLSPSTRIGNSLRCPPGYEKEKEYLSSIIKTAVVGNKDGKKSSTSVIIFGPPECGKTSFVESTLAGLKDVKKFHKSRKVVRLNGYLCTTFKSAIDEICRQLNIKDMLTSDDDNVESENLIMQGNTFDERLEQALVLMKENLANYKKSVVFILDNLELFAEQPNQGLLYNLFDLAANNSSIPVCIIGVTCRVDVLEMFEKRVKSRFSHRKINLVGAFKDFDDYNTYAFNLLVHWEDESWNNSIEKLYKSNQITVILRSIYDNNKSMGQLVTYLYTVMLVADDELKKSDFQTAYDQMFSISSKVKMALDLSTNELLVLIAIFKQIQNNTQQAWQPKVLYKDIEKVAASFSLKREDFMQAVRKIHSLQLITAVTSSQRLGDAFVNLNTETYFKSELSFHEFQEIWSRYPHIPSSFQELL